MIFLYKILLSEIVSVYNMINNILKDNQNLLSIPIYLFFMGLFIYLVFEFEIDLSNKMMFCIFLLCIFIFLLNMFGSFKSDLKKTEEERYKLDDIETNAIIISGCSLAISLFINQLYSLKKRGLINKIIKLIMLAFVFSIITLILWWSPIETALFYKHLSDFKTSLLTISITFLLFAILTYMPNLKMPTSLKI